MEKFILIWHYIKSGIQICSSFLMMYSTGVQPSVSTLKSFKLFINSFSKEPSQAKIRTLDFPVHVVKPFPHTRPLGQGDPLPKGKVCDSMWSKF